MSRKSVLALAFEITMGARYSRPSAVTTPLARPSTTVTSRIGLSVRISAPASRADAASAWVIAPIPPLMKPQPPAPAFSPMTWCMMT
jgi:hypothetical protein